MLPTSRHNAFSNCDFVTLSPDEVCLCNQLTNYCYPIKQTQYFNTFQTKFMDINEVSKSISHQVIIFYTIILFFKKKTQKI